MFFMKEGTSIKFQVILTQNVKLPKLILIPWWEILLRTIGKILEISQNAFQIKVPWKSFLSWKMTYLAICAKFQTVLGDNQSNRALHNLPQVQTTFDNINEDNLTFELISKWAAGRVYTIEAHSKRKIHFIHFASTI